MTIKTFPLRFSEEELDRIGEAARKKNKTKEAFIHDAIEVAVSFAEDD